MEQTSIALNIQNGTEFSYLTKTKRKMSLFLLCRV